MSRTFGTVEGRWAAKLRRETAASPVPDVPFRAHATFATNKVAGRTSPAQMTLPETTGTGSGDGCQRTSSRRSRVSDRLQNDAPERRASPSNQQRRTALLGARPRQVRTADGKGPCRQCSVPANVEVGRPAVLSRGGFMAPKSARLVVPREASV